jgi:hypothetical protein
MLQPAAYWLRSVLQCRACNERRAPADSIAGSRDRRASDGVVELVRRLPQEDQTAIEALVQQLARTAEDLSALPAAGDAAEEVPHHQSAAVRQFWFCCSSNRSRHSLQRVTRGRSVSSTGGSIVNRPRRHRLSARPRHPIAPSSPSPTPNSVSVPGSGTSGMPRPSFGDLISMISVGLSGLPMKTRLVSAGELSVAGSEKKSGNCLYGAFLCQEDCVDGTSFPLGHECLVRDISQSARGMIG